MTIVTGKAYDTWIYCRPNDSVIYYRIQDLLTNTIYESSATLTLPVNTTMLTANVLASNAALTAATSVQIAITRIYVETNY